jgi:hypothetical protein
MKVLRLVDRETKQARSVVVDDLKPATIVPILEENIAREPRVMTDEAGHYHHLRRSFADHKVAGHGAEEYVSSTIKGYFSIAKRGIKGVYLASGTCTAILPTASPRDTSSVVCAPVEANTATRLTRLWSPVATHQLNPRHEGKRKSSGGVRRPREGWLPVPLPPPTRIKQPFSTAEPPGEKPQRSEACGLKAEDCHAGRSTPKRSLLALLRTSGLRRSSTQFVGPCRSST